MLNMKLIMKIIEETEDWAIHIRRELHQWPELSDKEIYTRDRIEKEMLSLGIPTERILETGLVGTLNLGSTPSEQSDDKVVALRADMDALPIQEECKFEFCSKRDNVMHACGHDVHMAVLLGTARVLSKIKSQINGTVKFIFQPAEETTGGAERMIKEGCLKVNSADRKVDYILGLHVKPDLTAGTIGLKYGKMHASSDMFSITVKGKSAHGAYPHEGIDTIVIAAQIIANTQSIISRNINPINSAVITFGSIHGGSAKNIITDTVVMEGTIRTLNSNTREFLKNRLAEVVEYTAQANRATAEIHFEAGYPATVNNDKVVDKLKEATSQVLGYSTQNSGLKEGLKIEKIEDPTMGVEDFAYFLREIPGAFFYLGSGFEEKQNSGLHSGKFYVNEDCIIVGILAEVLGCLKLLETEINL